MKHSTDKSSAAGAASRAEGANLTAVLGAAPDRMTEGWTWHHGGRKWHYYRNGCAICGGMMLLKHPSEGYELGNDDSADNCAACRRKKAAEKAPNDAGNRTRARTEPAE